MKKSKVWSILIVLIVSSVVWSCANVTKRKYRSGYHIEWDMVKKHKNRTINNTKKRTLKYTKEDQEVLGFSDEEKSDSDSVLIIAHSDEDIEMTGGVIDVQSPSHRSNSLNKLFNQHKYRVEKEAFPEKKGGGLYWSLGGMALILLATRKQGRKLAEWAKENKRFARLLVGISGVLLPIVSFFQGWLEGSAAALDMKLGLFSGLALVSFLSYLHNKSNKGFLLRKLKEFFFIVSLVGIFNTMGSKLSDRFHQNEFNVSYEKSVSDDIIQASLFKVDETSDRLLLVFGKVLLSILFLVVSYFLEIALLFFSCSLACSGYGVAALILAIGGTVGLVTLLIWGLIKIWRRNKKNREDLTDNEKKRDKRVLTTVMMSLLVLLLGLIIISAAFY